MPKIKKILMKVEVTKVEIRKKRNKDNAENIINIIQKVDKCKMVFIFDLASELCFLVSGF